MLIENVAEIENKVSYKGIPIKRLTLPTRVEHLLESRNIDTLYELIELRNRGTLYDGAGYGRASIDQTERILQTLDEKMLVEVKEDPEPMAEITKEIRDFPIRECFLKNRVRKILEQEKIMTVGQLLDLSEDWTAKGVGRVVKREIMEFRAGVKRYGSQYLDWNDMEEQAIADMQDVTELYVSQHYPGLTPEQKKEKAEHIARKRIYSCYKSRGQDK